MFSLLTRVFYLLCSHFIRSLWWAFLLSLTVSIYHKVFTQLFCQSQVRVNILCLSVIQFFFKFVRLTLEIIVFIAVSSITFSHLAFFWKWENEGVGHLDHGWCGDRSYCYLLKNKDLKIAFAIVYYLVTLLLWL